MGINRLLVSCCIFSVILTWTFPTGQACIPEGLFSVEALRSIQQSSRHSAETNKQWIFPSIRFTCTANVTGWVFTAEASGRDIICPTVELWQDMPFTPAITDYSHIERLIPSNYTEPEALTDAVYQCTLLTPIIVTAGTVVGFLTSEGSNTTPASIVQLTNSANTLDGYSRNIEQVALIFNTALGANILSGSIPLITPIALTVETNNIIPQPTTTLLPSSSSPIIPTLAHTLALTSPPSPLTGSTVSPISQFTSETSPLPMQTANPSSEKTTSEESSTIPPAIVAIVVVIAVMVVIAVAVLFLVLILVTRHRRQISPRPSKTIIETNATTPGPKKSEISRVRSKNNYTTYNTGPIYEDVSGLSLEHKGEDHDYDLINSVSVGPNDNPKSYEVPQTSPNRVSSNRESLVYEVPGDILSADEGSSVKGDTYYTPMAVQGPIRRSVTVVESGYDSPLDTQFQNNETEESIYETPGEDDGVTDRHQ